MASIESLTAADCLNNLTSSEEIDNPSNARRSTSHLVANNFLISTPVSKDIDANIDRCRRLSNTLSDADFFQLKWN